jgi:hypothetical protein
MGAASIDPVVVAKILVHQLGHTALHEAPLAALHIVISQTGPWGAIDAAISWIDGIKLKEPIQ